MTLIDLDSPVRHRPGEAPVLRMVRKAAQGRLRGVLAVLVVLGTVFGLASSAVAVATATPRLRPIGPTVTANRYVVDAGRLFTVADDFRSVSAYSMVSGEALWRLESDNIAKLRAVAGVAVIGVTVVYHVHDDGRVESSGANEVFALDAVTGQRLWTFEGAIPEGAESAPFIVVDASGGLSAYDPRSGAPVWHHDLGPHFTAPMFDGSPRLVVQAADGALSIVDLRNGAGTPLGRLDPRTTVMFGFGEPPAAVTVTDGPNEGQQYAEGRLLGRAGTASWTPELSPDVLVQNAYACAELLCTTLGSTTTAADPADGHPVWQADSEWVNHQTMRVDGEELLVTVQRGKTGPRRLLLDGRTGSVRRDLANWSPIGAYAGRQLVQWIPGSTYDSSWLGYLDADMPGGIRPLFPLGPALRCSVTQDWLFCEVVGGNGQAGALHLDGSLMP